MSQNNLMLCFYPEFMIQSCLRDMAWHAHKQSMKSRLRHKKWISIAFQRTMTSPARPRADDTSACWLERQNPKRNPFFGKEAQVRKLHCFYLTIYITQKMHKRLKNCHDYGLELKQQYKVRTVVWLYQQFRIKSSGTCIHKSSGKHFRDTYTVWWWTCTKYVKTKSKSGAMWGRHVGFFVVMLEGLNHGCHGIYCNAPASLRKNNEKKV